MSKFLRSNALIILSAILLSISRLPLYCGWIVFVAFVPLIYYFSKQEHSLKELLLSALCFSFIQIGIVYYWIGSVTFTGLIGIWLLYSVQYSIVYYGIQRISSSFPRLRFVAFISAFVSFEFIQNFGEMRFAWFNIGYSLADYLPLIQLVDIGGMSLLAVLILIVNIAVYKLLKGSYRYFAIILLVFLVWFGYGLFRINTLEMTTKKSSIYVMQPSIPQDEKWDEAQYRQIIERYNDLCKQANEAGAKLLIFPEAAMPVYLLLDQQPLMDLQELARSFDLSIFTGFPHSSLAPEDHHEQYLYYNAATLFHPDGTIDPVYYKNILVPVAERMIWLNTFPFLWKLQLGQANWEFGQKVQDYQVDDCSFSPSICYELAFPHFMQKAIIQNVDGTYLKHDFHANITNDAWFGTSYGPWLHAVMAKFRAIETRTQIYRSANTGISMIIDPLGRVLSSASLFKVNNITAPLYVCSVVPIYRYVYPYPWLFVAFVTIMFGISLFSARRN